MSVDKKLLRALRKKVSRRVDREVQEAGMTINPSLNALLRFGGLIDLSKESQEVLEENAQFHEQMYEQMVFPQLPKMVQSLLRDRNVKFSLEDERTMSVEEFRDLYRREYERPANHVQGLITDTATLNTLYGNTPLPPQNYSSEAAIITIPKQGYIFSYRPKNISKLSEKQQIKITEAIEEGGLEQLYDFIDTVVKDPHNYWQHDVRKKFLKEYDEKVTDVLVGDNLGARILALDARKAKRKQDRLMKGREQLSECGFEILKERMEDYREKRRAQLRPGGVHLTATDKAYHLPLEIQVLDLVDEIYDKFGPHAHWRYTMSGKKGNPLYED